MSSTPLPLSLNLFSPTLPHTPPPIGGSSALDLPDRTSPPPTPTPSSSSAANLLLLSSTRMRAISPPTPAPSPQPYSSSHGRFPPPPLTWSPTQPRSHLRPGEDEEELLQTIRAEFSHMSPHLRLRLLTQLLADSSPSLLSPLLPLITPRLKRDFLRTLPLELAFHVLSFVDDVRTLARASGVSRFWRALLEDEGTWKRMCWKSGFGNLGHQEDGGSRLRTMEFGEREEEEGTPAGRERRGTLDREGLREFAARAELFGLRPNIEEGLADADSAGRRGSLAGWIDTAAEQRAAGVPGWESWANTGGLGFAGGFGNAVASTSGPRRSRVVDHNPAPIAPNPFLAAGSMAIDDTPRDGIAPSTSHFPSSVSPLRPVPHGRHGLLDDPPFNYYGSVLTSPRPHDPLTASRGTHSAPSDSPPLSTPRKPFSYKTHFKRAYLTESAWLRGPGRMLSTQQSADDGVVTSLGFDGEWIVVGMATSKVHVFEATNGSYVKTLDGHESGVWCLTLVSKGGGPRAVPEVPQEPATGAWRDERQGRPARNATATDDRLFTNDSPTNPTSFFRHPRASESPTREADETTARPRRKSFHSFESTGPGGAPGSGARTGGMGLGAGGETGDSSQQAGVCGTARGWGQPGAIVVSGGCDRDVRVWDLETGGCLHVLRGHTSTVRCMRVIDGRPIAVSGSRDATLRVWNIQTGEAMHLLAGHEHSVRCIDVSGNKVVSGSYDATCRLWDVDTGECLFVFRGHIHQIYAVAFDGIRVVTGSLDSTVRIWSATTGEFLALLQGHTSLVGQLQLDPISNVLVTGGSDGRVIVFNLTTFETRHRLCAHDNSVTCLQFDDRFIVTGGNDGRIKLWDFKTGAFIREIGEPCEAVWRVTFRDDKCVILCRKEGKTMMDVRTFRPSEIELHGDS